MSNAKYYFIVNPASNTGRLKKRWPKILEHIKTYLSEDQYEFQFTEATLHGTEITKEAINKGFTHIIAVGGDGIANEMVNGYMQCENKDGIKLGLVPAGTSNDGHVSYGLDSTNTYKAVDRVLGEEKVVMQPILKLTGDFENKVHYAWNHTDCGLSALAAKAANEGLRWMKGEFKYMIFALKELLKIKNNPGTLNVDGVEYKGDFTVIAAGLGDMMGGFNLWPGNNMSFGDLAVLIGHGQTKFQLQPVREIYYNPK